MSAKFFLTLCFGGGIVSHIKIICIQLEVENYDKRTREFSD